MDFQISEDELTRQANVLLSYYITQVPAHATYIVTGLFGIFATIIGVSVSTLAYTSYIAVSILLISAIFVFYQFGRLQYYNASIAILNDILGINSLPHRKYYIEFVNRASNALGYAGFANLIEVELFYRIQKGEANYKIKGARAWILRQVFFRQLRVEGYKKQIATLESIHGELEYK